MANCYVSLIGRARAVEGKSAEPYEQAVYVFPDGKKILERSVIGAMRKAHGLQSSDKIAFFGTRTSSWGAIPENMGIGSNAAVVDLVVDLMHDQELGAEKNRESLERNLEKLETQLERSLGADKVWCRLIPDGWEIEPEGVSESMRGFFSRDDNIIIDITHAAKHHSHLLLHSALAAGYSAGCAARSFLIVYSPGPQGGKSKNHASCELSGQSDRKEAPVLFLEKMAVELEQTHMMDAYRKTHDLRVLLPAISDNEIRCKIEELAHLLMVNSFDKANIVAGQIKGALKTRDVGILQTILEEAMELLNVQNRCARSIAYSRFHLQNGNYDRALMMLRETVYEYVQIAALGESKIEMSDSELKRFHDYLKKNKELRKQYQKLNNLRKICAHAAGNTVDPYSKKSEETLNDPKKLKSFLEEAILFWERAFLSTR